MQFNNNKLNIKEENNSTMTKIRKGRDLFYKPKSSNERKQNKYLINISLIKRSNERGKEFANKKNKKSSSFEYQIIKNSNQKRNSNFLTPNQKFYKTMTDSINFLINSCDQFRKANDNSSKIKKIIEYENSNQKYFNKTCSILKNIEVRDFRTFKNHWEYKFNNEFEDLQDLYKLHQNIKIELSDPKRMAARIEKYQTMSSKLKKIQSILNKKI